MESTLIQTLIGSGPLGLVAFLMLKQMEKIAAERLAYDKDRLEMDRKLERALTVLAMRILGRPIDESDVHGDRS
ncbi:hypothetical protein [Sphingosinicella sp. CPCC 101087]|uniref:hypothetical protein n=1 Tax=Sphingosinicella sp. CPCC 101087 TaxID=2497754 RepID=UPI00101D42FD|nr:hypothetical protein [Sphingosinicella sp. CPCC 101087]